jgi:hypothetical protein
MTATFPSSLPMLVSFRGWFHAVDEVPRRAFAYLMKRVMQMIHEFRNYELKNYEPYLNQ